MGIFPFGCVVQPCRPSATEHRDLFVLGAYPSALHVRWEPPAGPGSRPVNALAVDNEPEPFWTGDDQAARVDAWRLARGWSHEWGSVEPVERFNGPSGKWLLANVLMPLGVGRSDAWITDCLDTYRASTGMQAAIDSVYQPFAHRRGLPVADLAEHPSENAIVGEASAGHLDRLREEVDVASPDTIVTLGNAALRVLRRLMDTPVGPAKLAADPNYGKPISISITGKAIRWLPLAHPAAPRQYQDAHSDWSRAPYLA